VLRRSLSLFVVVALVGATGRTAARAQQEAGGGQVTFKSGVDLVRMDVRVFDATGKPITDLEPGELEIHEDGKRLPLVLFQRVTEPADSFREEALRAVTAQVSSNEAFPRGHLYILIFDQEHITPGNEQRARMAAEQFIRRRVRPSDRLALFAVPGPGPQLGFTADKMRAMKQLEAIRGSHQRRVSTPFGTMAIYEAHRVAQGDTKLIVDVLERMRSESGADVVGGDAVAARRVGGGGAEDPAITQRLLVENARGIVNQTDGASRQFLQRLADVIGQFRDIEGRKTVVLFSEGFFQDNLSRELEAVAAAAAQSYCVFYTFDLNARTGGLDEAQISETVRGSEIQARIAPLATLAVETDGMMIVDAGNRSGAALDTIADQAQDYYLLGFTPSEAARLNRGKYQRVQVRVTRPGARVSARTGYAVGPEQTPADRKRAINSVLGAPFAQQGLKIDYTTYEMKAAQSGQHRVILSLNADLPVRSAPGDVADIVFIARDLRDGRIAASGSDTVPLPETSKPGAALGTASWRAQFDLPPGDYMMRMVVREPGGLVGSADRRFDIRPLAGPDVTASDLVIGSAISGLPVRPRAYTDDGLTGLLEAYGRTTTQLDGLAAMLELRRVDNDGPVTTIAAELREIEQDAGGGARQKVTFVMPLTNVPPGHYIARAIVSARGEIVAERTRHVEVLAGVAPPLPSTPAAPVIAPIEIARGDLGRKYIRSLADRVKGTPLADAGRRAVEGRWEEADLALRQAAGDPSPAVEALRGFTLFVREDYANAAAALQRSLDAEQHALTAFFLGWAQDGAGDSRAAISAWRVATHLDPTLVSAHLALADGYLKISERALAVQVLRAGLAALPSSPELQSRLQQLESIR
jgi:VWFA-related protein